MKVFCLLPAGVCIDAYVMIRSYDSLITRLQLKKMSVMYESSHVAITLQLGLNEIYVWFLLHTNKI